MEPVAYTVEDAAKVSNLLQRFIQDAITKGELPTIKANRRRVILKTTLELCLNPMSHQCFGLLGLSPTTQTAGAVIQSAKAVEGNQMSERLLRLPEVITRAGLRRSALYERVRQGEFPRPVKLGRASAWVESEVSAWVAARIAENREG